MALPLEKFVKQLEDSGILAGETLHDFIPPSASPKDAEELARELVRQKKLTQFQAEEVSKGNAKSLFLGNYILMEKIGAGGMGQVFKARHRRMDRTVALKLLPPATTKDPAAIARFEREVKAAAKISHPNIVAAHDADCANDVHFLVMELVEGSDLSVLVKKNGPFPVERAVNYVLQAARGLEAAHAEGIVHRDIKPANLLLDKKDTVKVLDMGLARLSGESDAAPQAELTATGTVMGTVDYMAPEQAVDSKTADARVDIYALGCSLHFLLTGRPTYQGDSLMTRMLAHREQPIPSLRASCTEVPVPLEAIFRKMVAKKVGDRYQTMTQVIAALEGITGSLSKTTTVPQSRKPSAGLSQTLQLKHDQSLATINSAQIETATKPPGKGKQPFLLVGAALLGFALLAVVVVSLKTKDGTLIVEVDQPGATLQVDDKDTVHVTQAGGKGTVSISVEPGKHRLRIEKDGFTVFGKDFEMTAGGKTPIKAELVPLSAATSGWHEWPADAPKPAIAPFDAERAKKHQDEWAAYLKIPVEYTNTIGMKFRLIPPGEFTMGSTASEIEAALKETGEDKHWQECIKLEAPQHKVILTQPIYLGVNEVTQAEYEKVMGSNPSEFAPTGMSKEAVAGMNTADHPVEMVSWNDAAEFCAKLTKQEKLKPFYFRAGDTITPLDGTGYRLPSEAEWEFACRAGTATKYWIGDKDEDLVRAGWFNGNSGGRTHAAGELKANPFGLADIDGNVWEWVQDGWDATYYGQFQEKPAINPNSPFSAGSHRLLRGGNWNNAASACRSSSRLAHDPPHRTNFMGFRLSLVAVGSRVSR